MTLYDKECGKVTAAERARCTTACIGIDIGSTTVKATVVDPKSRKILWRDYQRHHTHQPEATLDFLERIATAFPALGPEQTRIFVTGSGAGPLKEPLGARFVQEVNAVTMSVEQLHPEVHSVIELGGQDAKIIHFRENSETGERRVQTSMNDKCASGTGATIDKCLIKVGLPQEALAKIHFDATKLHHVAAKCGVFAETDVVNLVKTGVPAEEILCSLADAIVLQNISVLARGNTLKDRVLLLGGPNNYLPFLQECWRIRIPQTWSERGYEPPAGVPTDELIVVPEASLYYAAYGAVLYGLHEPADVGIYRGLAAFKNFVENDGRTAHLREHAGPPLVHTREEYAHFRGHYQVPAFKAARFTAGERILGTIGVDGGSTSSKAVLIDDRGEVLLKEYQLSRGNPIQDTRELLGRIDEAVRSQGAVLEVRGFGVTGYAAPVLERALLADTNIVETVAHMSSALHYFPEIDVICDIGGQDIKVLLLQNRDIKDFRLSNQCSAGNGMLLQAMADQFGIAITEYADAAFKATLSPKFSYGCAVFLDADRVNFQKEGYTREEMLAGLALVLPKNIWQYVVQIPRMAELGTRFVLQGGTQHNLAAVKTQVDYICERVPGAEVRIHPHPGEAGAIGAAFEAQHEVRRRGHSRFVGLQSAIDIRYTTRTDESTRCTFCPNNCTRSFIDTETPDGRTARYISGFSCEKGTVENSKALKRMVRERKKTAMRYPNLVAYEARQCFKHGYEHAPMPGADVSITDFRVKRGFFGGIRRRSHSRPFNRSSATALAARKKIRIGMPRVLNMWSTGPFWRTYFETLGLNRNGIVFSDNTSTELWLEGGKYGSADACYPGKVAQAHIHNLLFHKHKRNKPLDYIYFPCITHLPSGMEKVMDHAACPIVAGTPKVMRAAFTKDVDFFAQRNIQYIDHALSMAEPLLFKQQMFEAWKQRLDITEDESDFAVQEGLKALRAFDQDLEERGRAILEQVETENRLAILLIGRPYHSDPGLNHGVLEEFQALGYPILSMRSIPRDKAWLERFFHSDLAQGRIDTPLEITDVWPENYSTNSVLKVWAAKFAARHPNVAVIDLSSFKCGHDAPTYGLIDSIFAASPTPYSTLHDIDANKPSGSIKIRVKTYAYTLRRRQEQLDRRAAMRKFRISDITTSRPSARVSDQRIPHEVEAPQKEVSLPRTSVDATSACPLAEEDDHACQICIRGQMARHPSAVDEERIVATGNKGDSQ